MTRSLATSLFLVLGCAAKVASPDRIDVDLTPVLDAVAELDANVEIATDATIAALADQSQRIVEQQQHGFANVSRVDQSTSDKWVNRGLMVTIALLVLPYRRLARLIGRPFRGR